MAKLTTKFVNNIKPTNQINTYWDETLKGFGLVVRPSGKKSIFNIINKLFVLFILV